MWRQKKTIGWLCVLLVVSSGWMVLASRRSPKPAIESRSSIRGEDPGVAAGTAKATHRLQGLSQSALVGENQDATTQLQPPTFLDRPSPGGRLDNGELFLRMMLSVGLILGLGGAAFYLSKRVLPRVTRAGGQEIRILETAYLRPRQALHLVEAGGQRLLLASTTDRITLLTSLQDPRGVPRGQLSVDSSPGTENWELRTGNGELRAVQT